MSTYPAGTVAIATIAGTDVRVLRTPRGWCGGDYHNLEDAHVTDILPLVVLDWGASRTHLPDLLELLRDNYWSELADQIESQMKPPRIEEPGTFAVVSTTTPDDLTTYHFHAHAAWLGEDGQARLWDDLIDPALIREGL